MKSSKNSQFAIRNSQSKKAVVLLSGGLDSATTLYTAQSQGYRCHCLIVDYAQRHRREVQAAQKIAKAARSPYELIRIRLPWGGSALTDRRIPVPVGRSAQQIGQGIPVTYVPARNTIFLSYATSLAEAVGACAVFIGANVLDYSGYPDCRPVYYQAFQGVIRHGTQVGVEGRPIRIVIPLIRKTKAQIIQLGMKLKVPYRLTWSCYKGGKQPCGRCDSCILRAKGFQQARIEDPALKPSQHS